MLRGPPKWSPLQPYSAGFSTKRLQFTAARINASNGSKIRPGTLIWESLAQEMLISQDLWSQNEFYMKLQADGVKFFFCDWVPRGSAVLTSLESNCLYSLEALMLGSCSNSVYCPNLGGLQNGASSSLCCLLLTTFFREKPEPLFHGNMSSRQRGMNYLPTYFHFNWLKTLLFVPMQFCCCAALNTHLRELVAPTRPYVEKQRLVVGKASDFQFAVC